MSVGRGSDTTESRNQGSDAGARVVNLKSGSLRSMLVAVFGGKVESLAKECACHDIVLPARVL